ELLTQLVEVTQGGEGLICVKAGGGQCIFIEADETDGVLFTVGEHVLADGVVRLGFTVLVVIILLIATTTRLCSGAGILIVVAGCLFGLLLSLLLLLLLLLLLFVV